MPVEEHKELRELVSHTLQAKGVLQKVQAEIRASVFLALEEQDVFKDKNPFINTPLKQYLSTSEGLQAISLIKEFLDFFNLEFTSLVFDPETHAGIDYTYEGRQKICKDLKIDIIDNKVPLLGLVLKILTSALRNSETTYSNDLTSKKDISKIDDKILEQTDNVVSNGINRTISRKEISSEQKQLIVSDEAGKEARNEFEKRFSFKKDTGMSSSMASLGDLPPLTKSEPRTTSGDSIYKNATAEFLLDDGTNNDGDLLLPSNLKNKNEIKNDANSEESEIEEDISEAASAPTDDNTVDLSISKGSGKADYLEDIQNRHLLD